MVLNFDIVFFSSNFIKLDKFEGADFKYDNSFSKFQSKDTQIGQFWHFHVFMKFTKSDKFEVLISNMTSSFSSSSPKILKSGTFSPKLKNFCTKLCNKTNKRTQIPNMTIVFSNSSTKIGYAKQNFWSQI